MRILCLPGHAQSKQQFQSNNLGVFHYFKEKEIEYDILQPYHPNFNENSYTWYYQLKDQSELLNTTKQQSINYILNYLNEQPSFDAILAFSQGGAMLSILSNFIQYSKQSIHEALIQDLKINNKLTWKLIFCGSYLPDHLTVIKPLNYQTLHIIGQSDTIILPGK
ncbi:hypothetical protein K502DRAFT_347945 [Neoconidiobolus thromboides FSU 785]|nr:hypothetical protein K502DRAFT_347945 [Neoconidiobolus thromboides FSU 785]